MKYFAIYHNHIGMFTSELELIKYVKAESLKDVEKIYSGPICLGKSWFVKEIKFEELAK